MSSTKQLRAKLRALTAEIEKTMEQLQAKYNASFVRTPALVSAVSSLRRSVRYHLARQRVDEIEVSLPFADLAAFYSCREYLDNWLAAQGVRADWVRRRLVAVGIRPDGHNGGTVQ